MPKYSFPLPLNQQLKSADLNRDPDLVPIKDSIARLASLVTVFKGPTANRPILGPHDAGVMYFDTTLRANGLPIWWTGAEWVDPCCGTVVAICPTPDLGSIEFIDGGTGVGLTGAIVLGVHETNTKIDAGYYNEASIGNYVWVDTDANGQQNETSTGLNGVIVELWDNTKTTVLDKVVTANGPAGDAGFYNFIRVSPGSYYVKCIRPIGYAFSRADLGPDTLDSDIRSGVDINFTGLISVGNGENNTSVDIGLIPIDGGAGFIAAAPHTPKIPLPAPPPLIQSGTPSVGSFVGTSSIGDRVWRESYANGVQNDDEVGKQGVYVYLHVADMSSGTAMPGEFIASQITDANGNYNFTGLAAGTYVLKFHATDGSVLTYPKVATYFNPFTGNIATANDFIDSDAYRTHVPCIGTVAQPQVFTPTPTPPPVNYIPSSTVLVINGAAGTGSISVAYEQDWFKVSLTAGTTYQFTLTGFDTVLRLLDSAGNQLLYNDDFAGIAPSSRINYTPTASGDYYLSAQGFSASTGTYSLTATA